MTFEDSSSYELDAKPRTTFDSPPHSVGKSAKPGPPPASDGGTQAWVQVAAAFCLFVNTWGLLNSFGAFQTFYSQDLLRTSSASDISWIGTVQSSLIMLGSVYSGPLYDWGYLRTLIATGSFLIVFGMFMTSLCVEYWQFLLAQGFVMGIGVGCLFTPTLGVIASHFTNRRALAIGIGSSGSTIGGVIYSIAFNKLIGKVSFGWTSRVIAFIMLALCVLPVLGMRMRTKPPAVRRIFEAAAWKEPEFTIYAIAIFLGYMGMYIPYFFIQLYCTEKGIVNANLLLYLLPIVNGSGSFGRIFFGWLADKAGPMNTFAVVSGVCSVLIFGWMGIHDEAGIIVFCVLFGFFSSGLISLPAAVVAISLCPDMRQFGVRITMQQVPAAIGLMIGNPIAGAILRTGWPGLQAFSASLVLACTLLTIAARVAKVGWAIRAKC